MEATCAAHSALADKLHLGADEQRGKEWVAGLKLKGKLQVL